MSTTRGARSALARRREVECADCLFERRPPGAFSILIGKNRAVYARAGAARAYSLAIPPTLERAMHDRRTQSVYDAECD